MKRRALFPWLKGRLTMNKSMNANTAIQQVPTLWLKNRPAGSLQSQYISRKPLRDRMEDAERHIQACAIAPLQEQMQTVWFSLVHEYIKSKKKGDSHDSSGA